VALKRDAPIGRIDLGRRRDLMDVASRVEGERAEGVRVIAAGEAVGEPPARHRLDRLWLTRRSDPTIQAAAALRKRERERERDRRVEVGRSEPRPVEVLVLQISMDRSHRRLEERVRKEDVKSGAGRPITETHRRVELRLDALGEPLVEPTELTFEDRVARRRELQIAWANGVEVRRSAEGVERDLRQSLTPVGTKLVDRSGRLGDLGGAQERKIDDVIEEHHR
jgi:hypothetical protein